MAEQVNGRTYVAPPQLEQPAGGLYDVAATPTVGSPHELMGVVYESEAAFLGKFVDLVPESCLETEEKEFEGFAFEYGQLVGHLYAGVTCQPFGKPEEFTSAARARLERSEEFLAERFLWEELLPSRGEDLNPAGALSITRGVGTLLEWAGQNYLAKPTLHFGRLLGSTFAKYESLRNPDLAKYVNGRGYFDLDGPFWDDDADDETPEVQRAAGANDRWMYVTGEVVVRRSADINVAAVDVQHNVSMALAERSIIPTVDVIVGAVRITLE